MTDTTKIYKKFGWDYTNSKKYQKTGYNQDNEGSKTSYSFLIKSLDNGDIKTEAEKDFTGTSRKIINTIKKEFDITDKSFDDKFIKACSGDGQEIQKITALHSSSLCSLLFFYDIDTHPITLKINNENIKFSQSFFEWKNPVFGRSSNIDVVLYSKEKNVLLFLESKFSEYCNGASNLSIPYKYAEDSVSREIYGKLCSDEGNFRTTFSEEKIKRENGTEYAVFNLEYKNGTNYIEGIKQMISHYLGVMNFLNNPEVGDKKYLDFIEMNTVTKVYLGEILFDKGLEDFKGRGKKSYLEKYQEEYKKLADILNADKSKGTDKKFEVLKDVLYYSELKNHVNNTIKHHYFGNIE